jgi:hypothetical protein
MSFARSPYGTTPYGGSALISGGFALVSASPIPNGTGVSIAAPVQFQVNASAEFDDLSLKVQLNGVQVILNSEFLVSFGGTIVFDGPDLIVTISSHPAFADGNPVTVDIEIVDLHGDLQTVSYLFNVDEAAFAGAETLTLLETLSIGLQVEVGETLTFVEGMSPFLANAVDTLSLIEDNTQAYNANPSTVEVLSLDEGLQVGALNFVSVDGVTVSVDFPEEMDLDEASDVNRYSVTANEAEAYPVTINTVELVIETLQTGTTGQVVETNPGTFHSRVFDTVTGSFLPSQVGQYLYITGSPGTSFAFEPGEPYRVIDFDGSKVTVDRDLPVNDPSNGTYVLGSGYTPGTGLLQWKFTRGATGALLHTTKSTNGKVYVGAVIRLKTIHGSFLSGQRVFTANASKPKVVNVQFLPEDGTLLVSFDELMRMDEALLSVDEYSFTGPTPVAIRSVRALDERTVALETAGFGSGNYTLIVNATGTPKDAAGNPIDPIFNMAIFSAATPLVSRSVFTDKGPIVKPPLTLQTGVDGEIQTYTTSAFGATQFTSNDVVLPGGSFTSSHVGLRIELGGTSINSGSFLITGQVNATRLRLQASFSLPDPNNGSMTWKLVDPRTGEIADDPADVEVRINSVLTAVQAVVGLLGQVVLPVAPAPTDDVKVDYSWIKDPTIEFRRLNSKEFRLNNWNNDVGRQNPTQHAYRYRNVTIQPATFMPDDIRADLIQPLFRELHYRAFERAYSVALNDPNLLVLNTPIHKIAYPPLSRSIESTSVSYTAGVLPENDLVPWERKGLGIASVGSGLLTVQSNTPGPFPTGNPLFWSRSVDLTFPHVFAATWRMEINSTTPNGIFTGVAVGWSNDRRAIVMGYLLDGGVRKLGFLKKGFGNDPSTLSAWFGGILPSNDPSGLPFNFDWSISHSYRFFRGRDEIVRLFVDGEVVESLRVLEEDLPYLEELGDPFDQLQGIFFGSLDRQAESLSTWDVVRYLVLPTNPSQTAPSIFASYEGDLLPENSPAPWTLVGYHGTESLLGGSLILDSTSATTQATSEEVGLVGGDFRGFTRIEPLLLVSADVVLDVNVQLRTFTHGVTPNAVMAAVDDGSRLIQLCFFPTQSQPKVSYPGRSLPEEATPSPWGALGSATARMAGRTLRIEDDSLLDGRVYFTEDLAPMASPDRIIEALIDYFAEFRLQVVSFLNDGTPVGFCGATVDVFDGTRSIGVMLRESAGVPQVAFHSDGTLLGIGSQFNFNWNDGLTHTYRITKSTGGDLVTLFIDNTLIGTYPYSSFLVSGGNPTISFGSATAGSVSSKSVVDWIYVNVWRAQPTSGVRKYVGIWKGPDPTSLTGYYFQLKASGHASLAGNVLTDLAADFVAAGVAAGGDLVIDVGPNKGVYSIATVSPTVLTILSTFPFTPSEADYRIPTETDWTVAHKYRLVRDPGGSVSLLLDAIPSPVIRLDYSEVVLPASSLGISSIINQGLASITWGAFDPTNISQTSWDFVRYGITRSPTEIRIVPHHQFLNQRNVMSSPEHLFTTVAHNHTQFSSSSTGIPYPWEEFAENSAVIAFTRLNEGTPLVPSTQTYEVRRPSPVFEFVSGLNRPEDVLNNDGDFVTNDATLRVRLLVPKDVLYNDLKIIEQSTGEAEHIAPFSDEYNPIALKKLNWTKDVCAVYSGDVLPENDPDFKTQWVLESDDPGQVTATAFAGVLTYSTLASPTNTIYRNPTPLTDPAGLQTTVSFKLKLLNDATSGTGDTGVRFGFNAFGLTAALAFVSTPLGDREVRLLDLLSNTTLGAIPFDFLDGSYHVYSLVKNVGNGTLDFLIDP